MDTPPPQCVPPGTDWTFRPLRSIHEVSYPTQRPLYDRSYSIFAKSLAAADSPAFAAAAITLLNRL